MFWVKVVVVWANNYFDIDFQGNQAKTVLLMGQGIIL